MSRYKICVYAITKNEEAFVDRWMDAVSEADGVFVADTGSADGTVARLRARGATVHEVTVSPWRFDEARNIALGYVPEDADICVSNDLDEAFEPGWREKLEAAWLPEHTRARYQFVWSHHADGTPASIFSMEKIHARHSYRWFRPVHEELMYIGDGGERAVRVDGIVLNHYPDLSKPRGQYLPLLELSVAENPLDDRATFWLGREYMYNQKYDECVAMLSKYLNLPAARWSEERSAAMRFIARCQQAKGDRSEAFAWLMRAVAECPDTREPYLALVEFGYREQNWPLVYAMVKKGLGVERPSGSYLVEAKSWGAALFDYGAISAHHLGLHDEALAYARSACDLAGNDQRLKANLVFFESAAARREGGGEEP